MKYRKLGASDLEVSEISLGSWLTFGVGVEADAARACSNCSSLSRPMAAKPMPSMTMRSPRSTRAMSRQVSICSTIAA